MTIVQYLTTFTFFLTSSIALAQSSQPRQSSKQFLEKLDKIVIDKMSYHDARNKQIDALKIQAHRATGMVRVNLLKEVFTLYSHYQTDSAQVYLDKLSQLSEVKYSATQQAYVHIGQAEICAVAGLYAEAVEALGKVDLQVVNNTDPDLKLYYYRTLRTLYGWMADYTSLPLPQKIYSDKTMQYRDTLLAIGPKGQERSIVEADKATATGNPQHSIEILLPYAQKMDNDNPDPYLCFTLYQAYHAVNKEEEALYYLILTTIADLQKATTEYQAMPILAQTLYEQGDIERSYKYLICSMEDANFCKAMLRSLEVSKIFPIIDKQYKNGEARQHHTVWVLIFSLITLLTVLSVLAIYLRIQIKKLHISREQLTESNRQHQGTNEKLQSTLTQLQSTNEALQQAYNALRDTDKVKEEYIAHYLNHCRSYIDILQKYQRTLHRLYKEHRMDELARVLKSESILHEEQEKFYTDFDAAFLTLFPNFIEKFNALLKPEESLTPKHEGQLNTELRIFALIRLGITDTQRIAHFLNYSSATVYNYRSKIRNKSLGDPAKFDEAVEQL